MLYIEILRDDEVRKNYEEILNKDTERVDIKNIDTDLEIIKDLVKKAVKQCVDLMKKKNNWYSENCRKAIDKRRMAKEEQVPQTWNDNFPRTLHNKA